MTLDLVRASRHAGADAPAGASLRRVAQITLVVVAVFVGVTFLGFVMRDGGSVLFTVFMAWFASIAIEPAVAALSKKIRRGAATGIVMGTIALFAALFLLAFGGLLVSQVAAMVRRIPDVVAGMLEAVNGRFGTDLSADKVLASVNLTPQQASSYASEVVGGALQLLGSIVGGVFSLFTMGLLTFYLSADAPRLRRWLAQLFPPRGQSVFLTVWQTTSEKTGGYVAARAILALINGAGSALIFWVIGMPSWLALGIWTGLVAQFVPTIGTYLSIVLPVIVGLQSERPVIGLIALVWAVVYQQIENLTLEPKISAKATDVHPAVAFTAVMLGSALFGIAGALLAVPVAAVVLSLVHLYVRRHALIPQLADEPRLTRTPAAPATASTQELVPAERDSMPTETI